MAKPEVTDWDETDSGNTDVSGIGLSDATLIDKLDDIARAQMGAVKRFFRTNLFRLRDSTDQTKLLAFDLSGITAATTRTLAAPDKSGTIALTGDLGTSAVASNLTVIAAVGSSALTVSVKGYDGNDPSASNPVYIPFRSASATSGDVDVLTLTAATSLVVSSGSTLGTASALAATLVVVGFNDAGTFRLGIINTNGAAISDGIASSTAEGGAGTADSLGVFYTGTAVASKAYAVLGYLTATEATAGTWATAPSNVQTAPAAPTALALMPFTKAYMSAPTTFTVGGTLSFSHGLGVEPREYRVWMYCAVTDATFSAGDRVLMSEGSQGTAGNYGLAVRIPTGSTTTIDLRIGSDGLRVIRWDTGTNITADPTKWKLIVKAWA